MQAQIFYATATGERDFECRACGAKRRATITGIGEGAATDLNAADTGPRRAREAAEKDIDDTLAVASCPQCGSRPPEGARRWWWKHAGLPLAIVLPLMGLAAFGPYLFDVNMRERDKVIVVWIMLGITVLTCGIVSIPIISKWRSAQARVKWH